jgi:hypothetical protein
MIRYRTARWTARSKRHAAHGLLASTVLVAIVATAIAEPVPTGDAREALARCYDADRLAEDTRREALERGLLLADRAIAADPDDPAAHFAAFCLLGKRVELDGISFSLLGDVRRVRRHVDRALALAPDWPAALAGKGAMLMTLPGLLGGDAEEGERLLRRAIALDPDSTEARDTLARLLGSDTPAPEARTADAD